MKKIKSWFSSPKKAIVSSLCIIALLATIGIGSAYAASAVAENKAIGANTALNFALADAGVDPAAAYDTSSEFDFAFGGFVYEVEFEANGIEYEYWIDSASGAVVKKLIEGGKVNPTPIPTQPSELISVEKAKSIALADAGLREAEVVFTEQKLDREDFVRVYEIEFYTASYEYEYEIDAVSGVIREKSKEAFGGNYIPDAGQSQQPTTSDSYIGLDRAKAIAVQRAGLSVSEVFFSKAKLDYDDGYMVYELEFYKGGMEYECTVDAVSGAILEYEAEWDD